MQKWRVWRWWALLAAVCLLWRCPARAAYESFGRFSLEGNNGWSRLFSHDKETEITDYRYQSPTGKSEVWVRVHAGGRPLSSDEVYYHATRLSAHHFTRVSRVYRGRTRRLAYTGARFLQHGPLGVVVKVILGIGGERGGYHLVSSTLVGESGHDPAMSVLRSFRGFAPTDSPSLYEPLGEIVSGDELSWLGSEFKAFTPSEVFPLPPAGPEGAGQSQKRNGLDEDRWLETMPFYPYDRETCEAAVAWTDHACRQRGCSGGWGAGQCGDCPLWLPTKEKAAWMAWLKAGVENACEPGWE